MILWLATGRPPEDDGGWQRSLRDEPWPPELTRVLTRVLAERPDHRYPDIGEWRTALEAALRPTTARVQRWLPPRPDPHPWPPRPSADRPDDRQSTTVDDHGITITVTGPTTAVVDQRIELEATVDGAESWQWIGPDGALDLSEDTIVLTPRTTGRSTVRLQAFDDQGQSVLATHRLEVAPRGT